ncbi:MAG: DNA polymerase [Bacilli bacterium]|nr:DNA polymerase [Bacilli bacterium]
MMTTASLTNIHTLVLDLETYSSVNLQKSGVYPYVEAPDFQILIAAVSVNGEEPIVYDLASGDQLPDEIIAAIKAEGVLKKSYNCSFERICLSRYLGYQTGEYLSPKSWQDTMILALYNGLPRSLKQVGEVLNLTDKKMEEGKDLIRYFCVPCKPTKSNGFRTRNLPIHDSKKWSTMLAYCKRDVVTEMEIEDRLKNYPVPDFVWDEFYLDQKINDTGILVDVDLIDNAIALDDTSKEELTSSMKELTELDNPNSVSQLKTWLSEQGVDVSSLGKKDVEKYAENFSGTDIGQMMELRKMLSKSSIKKYYAMKTALCSDKRIRGMFGFYGAKTGRWVSRIVQLQNLRRNDLEDLDEARELVRLGRKEAITALYDDIPDTLSQLVRTAFVAKPGCKFAVADFSAIECRVVAWLAGEQWVLDAFANNEDIYCATAEKMFHVPVKKHGENGELRQKGKQCTLSCSYGGGAQAMIAMGALEAGMEQEELAPLVATWRDANPNIVKFWWDIDKAIKHCIVYKSKERVGKVSVEYRNGMLFITLPSGRRLSYVKPKLDYNKFGTESVVYWALDMSKKWSRIESYGPKFVENITQAVARDILMNSMINLKEFNIVAHVHDELIIEVPEDADLDYICSIMGKAPAWADGLVLRADGYDTKYYKKD